MAFFELRTRRGMLEKARREHKRLVANFDIDNIFNFFVTAYHISDYILKTASVSQFVLDTFKQDQDIKDCHDLCDKGKHLVLTMRADPTIFFLLVKERWTCCGYQSAYWPNGMNSLCQMVFRESTKKKITLTSAFSKPRQIAAAAEAGRYV